MAATGPSVEELPAIDLPTLRDPTERAGDTIDPVAHADMLRRSMEISRLYDVRRDGRLAAYAMLNPQSTDDWFVRAFNVHPLHRNGGVMRELLAAVAGHVRLHEVATLRSHVYKTNHLSMAFHRRLGFRVTRENEKAVEFTATLADVAGNAALRGIGRRRPVGGEPAS